MSKKNELDRFMKNFSGPVVNIEAITGNSEKIASKVTAEPTP